MTRTPRIYLDNAATSWPKPETVYRAVEHYQRELGAPAGRGMYSEALEVARRIEQARRLALDLVRGDGDYSVVFPSSCTVALNMVIHGYLRPGDHVVTSVVEHNSVLRPLRAEQLQRGVELTYVDCDDAGLIDPGDVRLALRPGTRLVALSCASNVTGAVQPVRDIVEVARRHGARVLVDAAQALGHLPIDLQAMSADFVAAAGHKGPLGPLGAGLLYLRREVERELTPILQGGTGTNSEEDLQPSHLPERLEPGNLDVPAIFGLHAGLEYLRQRGVEEIASHSRALTAELLDGLDGIPGAVIYGPAKDAPRLGVVSFNLRGYDPQELAAALESAARIQVRGGLHCAGRMHARLNTLSLGGAVRVSFGPFNQSADVATLLAALVELAAVARAT